MSVVKKLRKKVVPFRMPGGGPALSRVVQTKGGRITTWTLICPAHPTTTSVTFKTKKQCRVFQALHHKDLHTMGDVLIG